MNNDYDRDGSFEITITETEPAVKLVLLLSGEELLSEVVEDIGGNTLTLINPLRVMIHDRTSEDGTTVTTNYVFDQWLPSSKDRRLTVAKSYVAVVTDPIDQLTEAYNNG